MLHSVTRPAGGRLTGASWRCRQSSLSPAGRSSHSRQHIRRQQPTLCRSSSNMAAEAELLKLSQNALDSIASGDLATYRELCHPSMTCFEPEAKGHLVEGLPFHEFYFKLPSSNAPVLNTMSSPKVRMLGSDAAIVTYIRLVQRSGEHGPTTSSAEETRVWQKCTDGKWQMVHVHRNVLP